MHNPALVFLVLIPLIGAVGVFSLKQEQAKLAKQISLAVSLVVVAYTGILGIAYDVGANADRFQFRGEWTWIKVFNVQIAVGVDGIALVLIAMSVVLVPAVILASWNAFDSRSGAEEVAAPGAKQRSVKNYFALLLLLEFFMIGVFVATDVFLFYVFFEAMLVPMYFIIGSFGGPRRQYAAMKFFLYSLVGGLLMLASVIGLYVTTGSHSFSITYLIAHPMPDNATQKWIFLGFFIAFAIKAPLVPFHTWLPDAGAEAPAGGAALLVGVLDKVGTFGFLRYCLPLFPLASRDLAPLVLTLAVIGVLYGALLAVGQADMKRFVAYTSVAHFGFIALGIFSFSSQAFAGATLYMVNHGLSTGMLFLMVGTLITRGGSRLVRDYGGVSRVAPLLAGLFLVAGLSSLALPGMNSFVSEFLVLVGSYPREPVYTILATVGIIFAALYVLWVYQQTMQGPLRGAAVLGALERAGGGPGTMLDPAVAAAKPGHGFPDLTRAEIAVLTPLVTLIVVLGFFPGPVLDVITPSVVATMNEVGLPDPVGGLVP